MVVLKGALAARLEATHRATVNSLVGFPFRAVYALSVPVMGAALRAWSLAEAFLLLAADLAMPGGAARGIDSACV